PLAPPPQKLDAAPCVRPQSRSQREAWVKGTSASTARRRAWHIAVAVAAVVTSAPLYAGDLVQWDPDPAPGLQGGLGAWNTSLSNWDDNGNRQPWFNSHGDTAVFAGDS